MLADHAARGAVRFRHVQHGLSTGTSVQRRQNRTPLVYCQCSLRLRLTSGFLGTFLWTVGPHGPCQGAQYEPGHLALAA
jgi:hypothetical protein